MENVKSGKQYVIDQERIGGKKGVRYLALYFATRLLNETNFKHYLQSLSSVTLDEATAEVDTILSKSRNVNNAILIDITTHTIIKIEDSIARSTLANERAEYERLKAKFEKHP